MEILRVLRKNKLINYFFRIILKKSAILSTRIHSHLIKKWTPSGIIDCSFNQYKFKYFSECDDGLTNFFYYNLPYNEKADLHLFTELSKKAGIIVDIGANTGLFSILSSLANPRARIYAVEPYNANANRMKTNIGLNLLNNIKVYELAIGDIEGEIQITVPKNKSITDVVSVNANFSKSIYPNIAWDSQIVKVKTLDTFAEENKIRIDLIKCDVESYEMAVFLGANKILSEHRPTIIFESFLDAEKKSFFNDILKKYDYYVYLILEQGVVHLQEGFVNNPDGLNYLITPVKPSNTFISFKNVDELSKALLLQKSQDCL